MCFNSSGLPQQRIVEQINLPDREIIRRAPPGVDEAKVLFRSRIFARQDGTDGRRHGVLLGRWEARNFA